MRKYIFEYVQTDKTSTLVLTFKRFKGKYLLKLKYLNLGIDLILVDLLSIILIVYSPSFKKKTRINKKRLF